MVKLYTLIRTSSIGREEARKLWQAGSVSGVFNLPSEAVFDQCQDFCRLAEGSASNEPNDEKLLADARAELLVQSERFEKLNRDHGAQKTLLKKVIREKAQLERRLLACERALQELAMAQEQLALVREQLTSLQETHADLEDTERELRSDLREERQYVRELKGAQEQETPGYSLFGHAQSSASGPAISLPTSEPTSSPTPAPEASASAPAPAPATSASETGLTQTDFLNARLLRVTLSFLESSGNFQRNERADEENSDDWAT